MSDDEENRRAMLKEKIASADPSVLRRVEAALEPKGGAKRYLTFLDDVARSDVAGLLKAEQSYGDSWKRRGGVGAFMMLARKWDRIAQRVGADAETPTRNNIFEHIVADRRVEGIIDDIRDLRRYLILVEAELVARGEVKLAREKAPLLLLVDGPPPPKGVCADSGRDYLKYLDDIVADDMRGAEIHGPLPRGKHAGAKAFALVAERWVRIEGRVAENAARKGGAGASRYDVLEHIVSDQSAEPIIEDVRMLRRYLMLIEAEMAARGEVEIGNARDNRETT